MGLAGTQQINEASALGICACEVLGDWTNYQGEYHFSTMVFVKAGENV